MTVEIPFEVGQKVCRTTQDNVFKVEVVESITYEVFVHVRDQDTGELSVLSPDKIYSLQQAKAYAEGVCTKINEMIAADEQAAASVQE